MIQRSVLFLLALLASGMAANLSASPVLYLAGPGGNVFPFGPGFYDGGTYQQLYTNWPVAGPTTLYGVSFASQAGLVGSASSYTFELSLSTTGLGLSGLANNFSDNVGGDNTMLFSGSVSPNLLFANTFDFTIPFSSPFVYDPANGNLLLSVYMVSGTSVTPGIFGFLADTNPNLGRVYQAFGQGTPYVNVGYGLQTRFEDAPLGSQVPEPATHINVIIGACALYLARRRKLS